MRAPAPIIAPVPRAAPEASAEPAPAAAPGDGGLGALKASVAKVESGGNYGAVGPTTKGDQPYGKYQVMGKNVGPWTQEVLGQAMTPQAFLADKNAQEKVADAKLGGYLKQYGNSQDAASMWFTGRPYKEASAAGLRDINNTTVDKYVGATAGGGGGSAPSGGGNAALAFAGPEQNQQQQQDLLHADPATQVNAAMEDAARAPDRKQMQSDFSMALMAAGFGMMAGTSSHAAVNIGQGALEGMKYMQTQRQLDNEWRKNDAQIEDYQSQARFRDAATNLSVQNLNLERLKFLNDQRMKTWALGGGVGPPPTLLGLGDLGGGTTPPAAAPAPSAAPAPAAAPSRAAQPPAAAPAASPAAAPAAPSAAAPPPIPTTPGAVVTAGGPKTAVGAPPAAAAPATPPATAPQPSKPAEAATAPEEGATAPDLSKDPDFIEGQRLLAEGARKNAMGKVAGIEGLGNEEIAQGQGKVDIAKARWDVAKKGQEEYSGALGESTGKAIAAIPAKMESRQVVDARLGEIQDMMGSFQTGRIRGRKS